MKDKELITSIDDKLTKRDWLFIEYRSKGLKVPEAYKLAGFKGKNPDSPYLLSCRLKDRLSQIIESNGFNRNEYMIQLSKILNLPLRDDQTSVTIEQKLKTLRLFKDSLPENKREATFTKFTIINNSVESSPEIIEVETLEPSNKDLDSNNKNLDS